ncbi:MAG: hypothetical protein U0796_08090 [Gemmatales bacterium]
MYALSSRKLIALSLMVLCCSSLWSQDAGKDEKRRVYDAQRLFSIIPPAGWDKVAQTTGKNMILARTADATEVFSNFNVQRISSKENFPSLRELAQAIAAQQKANTPSFVVEGEEDLKVDGRASYVLFSSQERLIAGANMRIHAASYMIPTKGNVMYIVTFSMPASAHQKVKPRVLESVKTIKIVTK